MKTYQDHRNEVSHLVLDGVSLADEQHPQETKKCTESPYEAMHV